MKSNDLYKLTSDRSKFFVIAMGLRKGSQLFFMKLEYGHFPPRTPENDLFELNVVSWQGTEWYLGSVPMSKKHLCYQVAESIGMRLADGIPTIVTHKGPQHFPCTDGPHIWSLEGQFQGDQIAEMEKILHSDKGLMTEDFKNKSVIRQADKIAVDQFLVDASSYSAFTPIMAVVLGDNHTVMHKATCFVASLEGKDFGAVVAINNCIKGIYLIPKARRLGIGTKLLEAAVNECVKNGAEKVTVHANSSPIYKMVNKLPHELGSKIVIEPPVCDLDLLQMEEEYLADKDWWMDDAKDKSVWSAT